MSVRVTVIALLVVINQESIKMSRYQESRHPLRSKSDGVGIALQHCADMIKEAIARESSLTPAQLAYVLNILSSLPGSDTEFELATMAGIAFYQLGDYIPR